MKIFFLKLFQNLSNSSIGLTFALWINQVLGKLLSLFKVVYIFLKFTDFGKETFLADFKFDLLFDLRIGGGRTNSELFLIRDFFKEDFSPSS